MYNAETKSKAIALYEAGNSTRAIAEKTGVSHRTIAEWLKNEEKGKLATEIQQKEKEGLLALAADIGLTEKRTLQKIVEFQDATRIIWVKDKPDDVNPEETEELDNRHPKNGTYSMEVPDYNVQLKGNQQAIEVLKMKEQDQASMLQETVIIEHTEGKTIIGIQKGC